MHARPTHRLASMRRQIGMATGLGAAATRSVAAAFGRLQWPAYVVLLATGIWNVTAVHLGQASGAWLTVLYVKVGVVLVAGVSAYLHQRATSTLGLAVGGAVTALASVAALALGVLLTG